MSDPHSSQNKKITHGLSRLVKELPSIFEHADYSKEVGILLITSGSMRHRGHWRRKKPQKYSSSAYVYCNGPTWSKYSAWHIGSADTE